MKKEKIFVCKGYGEYYIYNEHDLNCFWTRSLEWCGGKWIDGYIGCVIACHEDNLKDKNMHFLTKTEYEKLLSRMQKKDKDFYEYMKECIFANGMSTEEAFGATVKKVIVDENTKIEDFPKDTEFLVDASNGEAFSIYLSDIIDNEYYGEYLLVC